MAKCTRSKIYKVIKGVKREERKALLEMMRITHASKVYQKIQKQVDASVKKYQLRVQPSLLPGVGNGLFNTGKLAIPRGTVICIYPGAITPEIDEPKRKLYRQKRSAYEIAIEKHDFFVEDEGYLGLNLVVTGKGSDDPGDANNINHSCRLANSQYCLQGVVNGLNFNYVKTTKPVAPGQEITTDYGPDYWRPLDVLHSVEHNLHIQECMCGTCPEPVGMLMPA